MKQKGKAFIILTGLVTVSIHIINRIEYSRATIKNVLACSENNYYEWRFGKVRYIIWPFSRIGEVPGSEVYAE